MIEYIIAACNSERVIGRTLELIAERWTPPTEETVLVTVVVNNTSDATREVVQRESARLKRPNVEIRQLESPPGLGAALRYGVLCSTGDTLLLTADDLPFDHSDLDEWLAAGCPPVTIGSKAHRASRVSRSLTRRISTAGFKAWRRAVLRSRVGDPQGTLIIDGDLARGYSASTKQTGYLWTTELLYLLERDGHEIVEVPVALSPRHSDHGTRIRKSDVLQMGRGIIEVRKSHTGGRDVGHAR